MPEGSSGLLAINTVYQAAWGAWQGKLARTGATALERNGSLVPRPLDHAPKKKELQIF
jgi:hypothetical protein